MYLINKNKIKWSIIFDALYYIILSHRKLENSLWDHAFLPEYFKLFKLIKMKISTYLMHQPILKRINILILNDGYWNSTLTLAESSEIADWASFFLGVSKYMTWSNREENKSTICKHKLNLDCFARARQHKTWSGWFFRCI